MCVHTCNTHACTYTRIHTLPHVHTHARTPHTYTHTHMHTHMHTHTHIRTPTYTHKYTHVHAQVHTHIHTCTHIHAHTHTDTHMHACVCTHTYTHNIHTSRRQDSKMYRFRVFPGNWRTFNSSKVLFDLAYNRVCGEVKVDVTEMMVLSGQAMVILLILGIPKDRLWLHHRDNHNGFSALYL